MRSALLLSLLVGASSFAAPPVTVPMQFSHQGRLLDSAGAPLDTTTDLHLSIYADPTGGTALWTETQSVAFDNGYFQVLVGDVTAIDASIFDGNTLYMGIKVGTGAELADRLALVSVPYALVAGSAVKAESATTADMATTATTATTATSLVGGLPAHDHSADEIVSGQLHIDQMPEHDHDHTYDHTHTHTHAAVTVCDSTAVGALNWNVDELRVCDGTDWQTVLKQPAAGSEDAPGQTCATLLTADSSLTSGVYWVEGDKSAGAFEAYCDMTTDGGGWTRILLHNNADTLSLRMDDAVGTPADTSSNKLSSDQANALTSTAPYEALAVRSASSDWYRWGNNTATFNWGTIDSSNAWSDSACGDGMKLFHSTDGTTFTDTGRTGDATSGYNKGAYFCFQVATTYRIRSFIKSESEDAGFDFNDQRNSTSSWWVR